MERTELADQRTQWFAEYDAGETTRREFCEARGVKLSTFDCWRHRLRMKDEQQRALEVPTVAAGSSTIGIVFGNDGTVALGVHAEAAQIRRDRTEQA